MSVGTINAAKELALGYQPLLLATFTFVDGSVLRLCTHGLRTIDGGFPYGGHDYLPRILNQDIAAIQALSDGGIDVPPSVTLALNDADAWLWTNYEKAKGFRGARLDLTFVFWNVGANDFSSDSITRFRGICSAPQIDDTKLTVNATSLMNLSQMIVPTIRIQRRCPWVFPRTADERLEGAESSESWFYECGYSPDAGTGSARGNYETGSTPFTSCDYTKADCQARGMYTKDSLDRVTGRFGGVQWDPPRTFRGRSYTTGKEVEGVNNSNEAKYNDRLTLAYGVTWVDGIIANAQQEGNSTRFEVILCYGEIDDVRMVVVNDTAVPAATNMDGSARTVGDNLFRWNLVNRGDRDGAPNADALWDGNGDPYGSIATIAVVVPDALAQASANPRIRVLIAGPRIRQYTDTGLDDFVRVGYPDIATWSGGGKNMNPAWVLMDILVKAGWSYSELDLQSFIDAGDYCDALVSYKAQNGSTKQHPRFLVGTTIKAPKPASEIVRGLRNAMRGMLAPNSKSGGKLKLVIKQTLADQQPAPVPGSNYNTAISSKTAAGTAANGYVAYRFDPSNIKRGSFRIQGRSNAEIPTRGSLAFQDVHNNGALDSVGITDTESLVRNGNTESAASFPIEGAASFDHAQRALAVWLAESGRGNFRNAPIGDAGGSYPYRLETSFKAVHLEMGQLCQLHYPDRGISEQLVRVLRIVPSTNYETCEIILAHHSDEWYVDAFGQTDPGSYAGQRRNRLVRPAYPLWGQTSTGGGPNPDPMFGGESFFGMASGKNDDGQWQFRVYAVPPVNTFPAALRPPFVPVQGSTASTGGHLAGNRDYFVALCARNAAGQLSAPSEICRIGVPVGTNTNTISVYDLDWGPNTTGYALFVGTEEHKLIHQGNFSGTPGSISYAGVA